MIIPPESYPEYADQLIQIRYQVFVQEQGVPPDVEVDGLDPFCVHALLYEKDEPVATGRMQADGHIGRVAVLHAFRRQGLGRQVMEILLDHAIQQRCKRVWLSSQCHAVDFYRNLGFSEYGVVFAEAGIDHIHMEKQFLSC